MHRNRIDQWCQLGILGLVLTILTFGPLATGAVRPLEFLVIQWLTVGVLALWLVRVWLNKRPRFFWPAISWAVLVFAAYAMVRWLTADIEHVARGELLRVLVYAALFLAILNNLQRQEMVALISHAMIALGMVIAAYAIYQFASGDNHVWAFIDPYKNRGTGTYINPNHLAGFLELIFPVALAYAVVGKVRPVVRVFLIYAAAVIAVGIAVSFSRGGWLAVTVSLTVFFALLLAQKRFRIVGLVLLICVSTAAVGFLAKSTVLKKRINKVFASEHLDTELRSELWHAAWSMWQEDRWLGVGPGHYDQRFRQYRPASVQKQPDRVHNDYLNTLVDWGIIGVVLVAAAWVCLLVGLMGAWKSLSATRDLGPPGSNRFAFVLGASCGLVAILVHSFFDFNMHIPANAILVITWMALLTGHLQYSTKRDRHHAHPWQRIAVSTLLLLLGYALGSQGAKRTREYTWLERARHAPDASLERIDFLKQAFAVDPRNFETAYEIGEQYRRISWEGRSNYSQMAESAMKWFAQTVKLNPHHGYGYMRYGMCLDWLRRHDEAAEWMNRADELDPRGYFMAANIGWHYVQARDNPAAVAWFERSWRLQRKANVISSNYLVVLRERMLESATNPFAPPFSPWSAQAPEAR